MLSSHEYIIKKKTEGSVLAKKIFFIAIYAVVISALLMLTFLYSPVKFYFFFILCSLAFEALLIFITWRFTCIEYEVVLSGGDITVTLLYAKGMAKTLLNMPIASFSEIGEYDDSAYEAIKELSIQKDHICMSSLSAPTVYYAIFEEDDERCIIYFDVTEEAVNILKRENRSAFRASERRMKDYQAGGQAQ